MLDTGRDLLRANIRARISEARRALDRSVIMLRENDPRSIFQKGYAAVIDSTGRVIPDIYGIEKGGEYTVKMNSGSFTAKASDIFKDEQ